MPVSIAKGATLRPTSVILRRKLFDRHQVLDDVIFLDCFCGTGSMGIEAYSRGAEQVCFNDIDSKSLKKLKENLFKISDRLQIPFKDSFSVAKSKGDRFLSSFSFDRSRENWIFIDPPYKQVDDYKKCFAVVEDIVSEGGDFHILIESDKNVLSPEDLNLYNQAPDKILWHGDHYIASFYFTSD